MKTLAKVADAVRTMAATRAILANVIKTKACEYASLTA
jgi:hypothetical protein